MKTITLTFSNSEIKSLKAIKKGMDALGGKNSPNSSAWWLYYRVFDALKSSKKNKD